MRVIVCGSRNNEDADGVFAALDRFAFIHGPFTVIEGGQRTRAPDTGEIVGGVDYWANRWAAERGLPCETYSANWRAYGRSAGPMRNGAMLDMAPDMVLTFPGGRGTGNMTKQAYERGVPVVVAVYGG